MILVTGATGTNGVEVLKQLSALGEPARALVRSPEKAAKLLPEDVQLARGDLEDPGAIAAAMDDVEKVFLLAPVDPRQVELEANVINAAKAAGVRHLVKFSVLHASLDSPSELLRLHAQCERNIRESDIPFTFLRPNIFMQEILRQAGSIKSQGVFHQPFGADVRLSFVDVRDNALVAAKVLSDRGHEGETYEITGPEALSFDEVAAKLTAAAAKRIGWVQVTMEEWKKSFRAAGAPEWLVETVAGLYATFVPANAVIRDGVRQVTGQPARSFDEFARDHATAFA